MVSVLQFENLQKAWEGINLYLATTEPSDLKGGGGSYGTEYIAYNTLVTVNSPWVDPNFDFAKVLGYTDKKWTTLVKNYVDFNYLDLLKSEITTRRNKKARSYNYSFHFANKYGGGKDCLLTLVFSKRVEEEYPTVFFNVRVSEVTSRLIFDFLLVQRIIEYVYGKDHPAEIHFYAPSMFITAERFIMFANWYGWDKIEPKLTHTQFGKRIVETYKRFKTVDPNTVNYQVHKRCVETVQGIGKKNQATLLAQNLKLNYLMDEITPDIKKSQIRKLRTEKRSIIR